MEIGQGDHGIEKLNLSNLSGETSDVDTIPFQPTPHSEKQRELTPHAADLGVHFQQQMVPKVDNFVNFQQQTSQKGDTFMKDKGENMIPQILPQNLPCAQPNVPKLLTPADFMSKQAPVSSFANKQVVLDYQIHSETQSVASTPRVLCQSADHSHPLTETYTLPSGNARDITPRSLGEVTPRSLVSGGGDPSHVSSQQIQKEIVQIRNRLKSFDQKKKKLR